MPLRLVVPRTIELVAEARLPTEIGEFRIIGFRSLISNEEFVVLVKGELRQDRPSLVRVHSQCMTGDVFGSVKCDCGRQLEAAMKLIEQEGHGRAAHDGTHQGAVRPPIMCGGVWRRCGKESGSNRSATFVRCIRTCVQGRVPNAQSAGWSW